VTYPLLVTIVYWALIASPSTFETRYWAWSNISKHALNSVFALFEIFFTNVEPIPWLDLAPCLVMLGCYLGLAYITYATQGFYTYAFLNPETQGNALAGYIIGIAVAECIIFAIVKGLMILRSRFVRKRAYRETSLHHETESVRSNERLA